MIRYRIIERVGCNSDEWVWMETDEGVFTAMPGWYAEPTMQDAADYATKFNEETRKIQFTAQKEV